jgi:two-component system sensor histidine kinase KdpD
MLDEGRRRASRGTDVVIGLVETHGRIHTAAVMEGLEVVARGEVGYRGAIFAEMDADAVIRRAPQVVLVDELAHTNTPGSANEKRWQDIEQLLDAGIDVISTVNIQHLESVHDVVEHITGTAQRETVPDEVVRRADQVELVDMAPEALRRRMAHGNIYRPERIDAALSNYFRVGNLTALRELALLWVADKVDEQLSRYRAEHNIAATWEARECVVVALSGGSEGDTIIRRAARIAARSHAELLAVHVTRIDGLVRMAPVHLERQRGLVESLGGTYHQVVGDDVSAALLEFARAVNATQLVLGTSRRGRLAQLLAPGVGSETTVRSGAIDIHTVNHERTRHGRRNGKATALTRHRRSAGFGLAAVGLPLLTALLANLRTELSLISEILLFLVAVVGVALVGGLYPALVSAVAGFLLLEYYFAPPLHSFAVADPQNVLALIVYLVVGVAVSVVVDVAARRTEQAAQASADATVLATLSGSVVRGADSADAILDRLRHTYTLQAVTLLERLPGMPITPARQREPQRWRVAAGAGADASTSPDDGDTAIRIDDDLVLVLRGHVLGSSDRRILEAFAAQAVAALQRQRLRQTAEEIRPLQEADRLRTALLNAVGHDFRTPLAAATAAVDSLQSDEMRWNEEQRDVLVDIAAESLRKLHHLVENLLDLSRLRAGALGIATHKIGVSALLEGTIEALGETADSVHVGIAPNLPDALVDPVLLDRALDNIIRNALRYAPDGSGVLVTASAFGATIELRVIDHGPGVPLSNQERIFQPFQRLDDRDNTTGIGLGLALARGLVEAMGGSLTPDDTPGGGLTMILTLPAVHASLEPAP